MWRSKSRSGSLSILVIALLAGSCSPTDPARQAAPVPISDVGGSPYDECVADRPIASSANHSGEVEPSIAVDPQNPDRIAVAWQQDRFFDGAARGIVAAVSSDAGENWDAAAETGLSSCSGGDASNANGYTRVTDPWLSFGAGGALHLSALSLQLDRNASVGANHEAVLVTTSEDGGRTWKAPISLIRDDNGSVYNDKPSITADPVEASQIYAVWNRLSDARRDSVDGDTLFARSTDGGSTWGRARPILGPLRGGQSFGNEIVVLPRNDRFDGELVNVFSRITYGENKGSEKVVVAAMSSGDRGRTWSEPVPISALTSVPVRLPGAREELKTGRLLPRAAVDPKSGALYVAWNEVTTEDGRFNDVVLSTSLDGGRSWSPPVKVNRTPDLSDPAARQTFTPEIAVGSDGEVGVSYFDLRNSEGEHQGVATDLFVARCQDPAPAEEDGCAGSWVESRLTPRSFDLTKAPNSGGPFLGDYIGLAGAGSNLVAAFARAGDEEDPSSIAFAILERLPPDR